MKKIPETIGDHVALHVEAYYGTQKAAADAWACSGSFLNSVIHGVRRPNAAMLKSLGMERKEVWVPVGVKVPGVSL